MENKNLINIEKYKWVWFLLSFFLLLPGVIAMIYSTITYPNHTPLKVGIDYTGGTILQYSVDRKISNTDVAKTRQDLENFDFTSLYEKSVMEVGNSAYYEFQLHGESSHTLDNLQEIVFLKKPEAQIIEKLKELNISWRVIK